MMKNKKPTALCKLSEIDDSSSKSFTIKIKRKSVDIFVIHKNKKVFAYQNICPHAQASLEWNPDEFLDEKKETIICALHGARFSIDKGECLDGPCSGVGLTPVSVKIDDDEIFLLD